MFNKKEYCQKNKEKKKQYDKQYYLRTHIKGKCKTCGSQITLHNKSKLCRSCYQKKRLKNPKNNPNYKTGGSVKKYWNCIICGKKLSNNPSTYCKSCWQLGKNNPMFGKSSITKHKIVKHHINKNIGDNRNSNLLFLSASKHTKLHHRAYDYLVKIGQIKNYIKWFFNEYLKG
jgi:ribosomal protein S14